jgi:diguanylate cyclase (GGDEF)-like protein
VESYERAGGRVVGSARRLDRFGWVLVVEEPYAAAFAPVVAIFARTLAINLAIVLLFGAVALQITTSIVRPIRALVRAARQVREGRDDAEFPSGEADDEIGLLVRTFREMVTRLHEVQAELRRQRDETEQANARLSDRNSELERANEVLAQLSITDGLTSLHNHRFFQDHLGREVARAERHGTPLSLVLIDIDDFKLLNDRHGHATGDAVLRRIAEVLSDGIRDADLLARYGGEEFVLVAPGTDLAGAASLAEKLRLEVSETVFDVDGTGSLRITVSIGVAAFHGDRAALFGEADRALYLAKSSGKDCVMVAGGDAARPVEGQPSRSSEA